MNFLKTLAACVALLSPLSASSATLNFEGLATVSSSPNSNFSVGDSFAFSFDFDDSITPTVVSQQATYVDAAENLLFGGQAFNASTSTATARDGGTFSQYFAIFEYQSPPVTPVLTFNGVEVLRLSFAIVDTNPSTDPLDFASNFDPDGNFAVNELRFIFRDANGQNQVTFDVSGNLAPIPLPAGMPLLLGGLVVFGLIRRKSAT